MFEKSYIAEGSRFSFLRDRLSNDFSIPDDGRSKVVFGYNGIGKTSIFRFIKEERNDTRLQFLDYIDERSTFLKNKKKVTVAPFLVQINELKSEVDVLKNNINSKDILITNYGLTRVGDTDPYGAKVKSAHKGELFMTTLTHEAFAELVVLSEGVPSSFVVKNKTLLSEITSLENEISNYKQSKVLEALTVLSGVVDVTDTSCPICDSHNDHISLAIQHKINALTGIKSELIENMRRENIEVSDEIIDNLRVLSTNLDTEDKVGDWMICNGDLDRFDMIVESTESLREKLEELDELTTQADEFYDLLKGNEEKIKNDICRYFVVPEENIKFSDSRKELTITLDREVKTYSTGELNFLSFLIRIYEFIGSDKSILILDDPVSSLDIINHYKIVYEIVRTSGTNKQVIVLTHSIDMLNAINSQHGGLFDFYYIDKINSKLVLQKISGDSANILTLDRLLFLDDNGIIEAMIKKENAPFTDDVHKLFHYSGEFSHPDYAFSNSTLIDLINNYEEITSVDFMKNSYKKVIYIASLRVWVEEKLRSLLTEAQKADYDNKNTISDRINFIMPRNDEPIVELPINLSREKLMSKKVMLNQGIHYQSRVMPFAYALNLSLDDIIDEIADVQTMLE